MPYALSLPLFRAGREEIKKEVGTKENGRACHNHGSQTPKTQFAIQFHVRTVQYCAKSFCNEEKTSKKDISKKFLCHVFKLILGSLFEVKRKAPFSNFCSTDLETVLRCCPIRTNTFGGSSPHAFHRKNRSLEIEK